MFFKGKQKLIKILTAALVLLTAVSICIAGYTFARYSTSAGGTGTSAIALWNVNISPKTTTTTSGTYDGAVTFGKLSPGDELDSGNAYVYYNNTNDIDLATVTYQTDVKVAFSIETSDFTIYFNDGSSLVRSISGDTEVFTDSSGNTLSSGNSAYSVSQSGASIKTLESTISTAIDSGSTIVSLVQANTYTPTYQNIAELFTVDISYSGSINGNFDREPVYAGTSSQYITGHTYTTSDWGDSSTELTIELTGSLVWAVERPASSSVTGYDANGNYYWATYLCDWVGKYVDSVSYTFTYSARQASEAGE